MPGKQAKILSIGDVNDLLIFATCTRHPLRNRVIVLLAAKAGLRAGEIAKLTWDMVLDPTGDIGVVIEALPAGGLRLRDAEVGQFDQRVRQTDDRLQVRLVETRYRKIQ
jgi:integrase